MVLIRWSGDGLLGNGASNAHELHGHGNERLAQLEVLLSHDAWEPVVGREMLWREHRLLLLAQPLLRSYLVPPADISESAAYWEPPPCALCGRAVWPDSASGCYMHWCDRCAKADSEQTERRTRQEQEWRRQEYQRRMREKRRCYGADPGHVRKSGAPPSAYNSAMPPPAFYLRHATTTATTGSATATTLPPPPPQRHRHRHRHRHRIATTAAHKRFEDVRRRGDANAAASAMANILGLPREALSVKFV